MGGVSYYVTAAVVRCAQVLYTENRQSQKSVEKNVSIICCKKKVLLTLERTKIRFLIFIKIVKNAKKMATLINATAFVNSLGNDKRESRSSHES